MTDMNMWTKKKTCKGCAASRHLRCDLGYSMKLYSDEPTGIRAFGIPDEMCPKPRTTKDFIYANKWYRKVDK